MNKKFFIGVMAFFMMYQFGYTQKINQREVPSVIVNRFQQDFPEAKDIEWKKNDTIYKVDFEMGWRERDHEIWYGATAKTLRHKQEISKKDLPEKVSEKLKAEYRWYLIKDTKKIVTEKETVYTVEAKSFLEEWKLTLDPEGNILGKVAD